MENQITIGKLSKISGVSTRTIRYYESIGLLSCATNTAANYRLYGIEEIRRLEKILLFKSLGFSLEDIDIILSTAQNERIVQIFNNKLNEFERKAAEILEHKDVLASITRIYELKGVEYVNNHHLMKEMIFMNNLFTKTFNKLDLKLQIKILTELYHTGNISSETIKEIGVESGARLLNDLHMVLVKTLLNKVDRSVEKSIMESLEQMDKDFAEELKKQMFTFEDIVILPDDTIQKWLKKCNDEELSIALSESSNFVRSRVFNNMLSERVEKIKLSIENLKPLSLDEIYQVTTNLVEVLKQMDYSGEIVIEDV